ncbi:MAG: 2-amino-5-chloromuconate deaminase [Alphaproteobacteria bacterium]|nr:2-amino-5-chloromuconate deaminase [Alphaproteobacteria bacterium]HCP01830.1 2-amino-5-chloromuconate deaminase [Rhodospirillaceae bacterium]
MTNVYEIMGVGEHARAMRDGDISAADLAEQAIARHEDRDHLLGAYKTWEPERLRAEAEVADRALAAGIDLGPLQGIPISVKDLYGVRDYPTFAGSPRELPPEWRHEGPVVRALRHQLAMFSGKTHTVQFAFGALGTNPHWGTPRNPWDANDHRAPGGSSAGAGVSLWEGSALLALGTDTAGSVRMPASMTGTVGIKTTQGRWSIEGIAPLSPTLDTPGVLAQSVADAALGFAVIDPAVSTDINGFLADVECASVSDFRIGVCEAFFDSCDPGIAEGVRAALVELEAAGMRLTSIEIPDLDEVDGIFRTGGLSAFEFAGFIRDVLPDFLDDIDPMVGSRFEKMAAMTTSDYLGRMRRLGELSRAAHRAIADVHAVVGPTVPITPPKITDIQEPKAYMAANLMAARNTTVANLLAMNGVTIPVALDGAGMPVGLQIMCAGGQDNRAVAIARSFEKVLGSARDRLGPPPLAG